MDHSVGMVTALNPVLGYEKTTELAKEALESGKGIIELIREKKLLTEDQIKELMDPAANDRSEKIEQLINTFKILKLMKNNSFKLSEMRSQSCC